MTTPLALARAKVLRRNLSDCEKKLWGGLRANRLDGLKFYRQVPVGPFIVDFMHKETKLAIELDGTQHFNDEAARYDASRDAYLRRAGYDILRIPNSEVIRDVGVVLDGIFLLVMEKLQRKGPLPPRAARSPLSGGEGK